MKGGALISQCGVYRFRLWRVIPSVLDRRGTVLFIMLNPSTADDKNDDPTIRRCMGYAERWAYKRLEVVNLSPIRATSPKELKYVKGQWQSTEEIQNEGIIEWAIGKANLVVAAWGAAVVDCGLETAAERVQELCEDLHVLGLTKYGHPRHPLYMPRDAKPTRWER
jgi:hypothetical protein